MPFKLVARTAPKPTAAATAPGAKPRCPPVALPKVWPVESAWSFSRYSDYKQCPLKYASKHLLKVKEPGSAAMDRGIAIHKMAEDFTTGKLKKLPAELNAFAPEFKRLAKLHAKKPDVVSVEGEWAFNRDWAVVPWFGGPQVYARIKLDLFEFKDTDIGEITDHKTGKYSEFNNETYAEQLQLYALAAFKFHPQLAVARPRILYVDHGIEYRTDTDGTMLEYTRAKDERTLVKLWEKKVLPMLKDTRFAPTANDKCHWCHYRKSNGGPCKY